MVADIPIPFPLLGVDKAAGYQRQPPFSCVDASNVYVYDKAEGRARGGSRPPLGTYGSPGASCKWAGQFNYSTGSAYERRLVALTGSTVQYRTHSGSWTGGGSVTISSTQGSASVMLNKLYICQAGAEIAEWTPNSTIDTSLTPTAGLIPSGNLIAATHQDRLYLSGNPGAPNEIVASAQGDPLDWDYGLDNLGSAIQFSAYHNGQISEPVTALVPITRDCMLISCTDSMWVLRGNPTAGDSQLVQIAYNVGFISQHSWCYTPSGIAFLTRGGLYGMPYGCGTPPTPIGEERLPVSLIGYDVGDTIAMAYDRVHKCIGIYINPATGSDANWWYDTKHGGFWPMSLPAAAQPTCAATFSAASGDTEGDAILFGSGGAYQFDRAGTSDYDGGSGTAVTARVDIGAIRLTDTVDQKAMIKGFRILESADAAASYTATLYVGNDAEEAAAKTGDSKAITTARPGVRHHPRLRGHAAVLSLQGTSAWMFEEASLTVTSKGRMR